MTRFDADADTGAHPSDDPAVDAAGAGAWTIALDGGTTNTRARLLRGARLVATARRGIGVRDAVLDDPRPHPPSAPAPPGAARREALVRAVREAVAEVRGHLEREISADPDRLDAGARAAPIVAAGMLSSEVGLVAVPHVGAPAGLDELARGSAIVELPEVDARPILMVPGVRTPASEGPDGWFDSDVMRGEECETIGAHGALIADGRLAPGRESLFLWPGSHTKLVAVAGDGRIIRSFTTLAGEILQAVAHQTLLAASLPATLPDDLDPAAAEAGRRAAARHGLGRAAFLVRIAALGRTLDDRGRASFWIGAAVEADIHSLLDSHFLADRRPIWVGGRHPLRGLYADGLARRHGGPVVALDDPTAETASALGARAVAEVRAILERRRTDRA